MSKSKSLVIASFRGALFSFYCHNGANNTTRYVLANNANLSATLLSLKNECRSSSTWTVAANKRHKHKSCPPPSFQDTTLGWTTQVRVCSSTSTSSPETSSAKIDSSQSDDGGVEIIYYRGLPSFTIPLPSRREKCRFIVKPLTNTVDGTRIASSNTIELLMEQDFNLIINDRVYQVVTPPQEKPSKEDLERLSSVRNLVGQLYAALNVDEHQLRHERELLTELEKLQLELAPMEEKKDAISVIAKKRTNTLTWIGLGFMSLQFGILARLTWWDYSWDIVEPITYFVTYGTTMLGYAYFVITRQEYLLPEVKDRQFLLTFHENAKKVGLEVDKYNALRDQVDKLETDLRRLRDPLALRLPLRTRLPSQLELDRLVYDTAHNSIMFKATQKIQQIFKKASQQKQTDSTS